MVRLLGMQRLARLLIRPGIGGGPTLTPERTAWLRAMLASNDATTMAPAAAELSRFDSRPWLNELRQPTLVVFGGLDTAVPAHHAAMLAQGIPAASTATIAAAGHSMVWTHPDSLARILAAWWDNVDHSDEDG